MPGMTITCASFQTVDDVAGKSDKAKIITKAYGSSRKAQRSYSSSLLVKGPSVLTRRARCGWSVRRQAVAVLCFPGVPCRSPVGLLPGRSRVRSLARCWVHHASGRHQISQPAQTGRTENFRLSQAILAALDPVDSDTPTTPVAHCAPFQPAGLSTGLPTLAGTLCVLAPTVLQSPFSACSGPSCRNSPPPLALAPVSGPAVKR